MRKRVATVYCDDWNDESMREHAITDLETGRVIGMLQPIDYESIARNPAIQPWSKKEV